MDDFLPTIDKLHRCTKDHLFCIADHFSITVPKQLKKQALTEKGVLVGPSSPEMTSQRVRKKFGRNPLFNGAQQQEGLFN